VCGPSASSCGCSKAIAIYRWGRLPVRSTVKSSCPPNSSLNKPSRKWRPPLGLIRRELRRKFFRKSMPVKPGKCFLVGAGPGDLGVLTLRAKQLIEQADVIVYDALCNREMLAWTGEGAEVVCAGQRAGGQ